uniref:Uncharacterized protein n=1 Tax=Parastrongyloides trichosuri TaxID=131310 RepID=A0A0N5A1F8_PARTI
MVESEYDNWRDAFKKIHNKSPRRDDYETAPVNIREYFIKKDTERRSHLKRKRAIEEQTRGIVAQENSSKKQLMYSNTNKDYKSIKKVKIEDVENEIDTISSKSGKTPSKNLFESPLKGWRMPTNFKNNVLKTPTSEGKKNGKEVISHPPVFSPTKVILSKKVTGDIRKKLYRALKKVDSDSKNAG